MEQRKLEGCRELSDFVDIHFLIGAASGLVWYRILGRHAPLDRVFAGTRCERRDRLGHIRRYGCCHDVATDLNSSRSPCLEATESSPWLRKHTRDNESAVNEARVSDRRRKQLAGWIRELADIERSSSHTTMWRGRGPRRSARSYPRRRSHFLRAGRPRWSPR